MMHGLDHELAAFKANINLTEYAAALGYEMDVKESTRNSVVMRHSDGDKLIVARDTDNHWIYFSVRDESDHGTIIDFVQRRKRLNLGEVRKELRPWAGSLHLPYRPHHSRFVASLQPVRRDLVGVRARWEAARDANGSHPYLEQARKIPADLLGSERFRGRVRIDDRNNAVFPHWNHEGLCGFELKNEGFTGFAPGGIKGLWGSRRNDSDQQLVIAETAIDALSYAALFGFERSRFISIAGSMNDEQPVLIREAILKLPAGSIVVAAFDHDDGGRLLLDRLRKEVRNEIIEDIPNEPGEDWNDVLRQRAG